MYERLFRIVSLAIPLCSSAQQTQTLLHRYAYQASMDVTSDGRIVLHANDPRPLYQMILGVDRQLGLMISYEDPPFYSTSDLTGSASPQWLKGGGADYMVPSGSTFDVEIPGKDISREPYLGDAMQIIANAYNRSTNPGRFLVKRVGEHRISMVGSELRNRTGAIEEVTPILDSHVALLKHYETIGDALRDLLSILNRGYGKDRILLGAVSANLLALPFNGDVKDPQTAREVLSKLLDAFPGKVAYVLLYDANAKAFMLSVISVGDHVLR